jgi:hypothetical protein
MLVWAGTYTDIEDSGTMFNTGYWQYGEYITLSGAQYIFTGLTCLSFIAQLL